jgi:uncharacterized lipoprotein YmbA
MRNTRAFAVVVLILFAACVSAPKINRYVLAVEPSGGVVGTVNLEVERLLTIDTLGSDRIYIQASPTRVEYYATDLWAGNLGELVAQKLGSEFGPAVPGRRTLRVSGTVLACGQVEVEGGAGGHVRLEIVVRDPERKRFEPPLLQKTYERTVAASAPSAEAVVIALSRAVEKIASEIAADATAL